MAAPIEYHMLKKYTFGTAAGSTREYFDYITVDSAARRVYLTYGPEVVVMDGDSGTLIGKITGLKVVHGVAVASEFGRGFISDGEQGKVIIFDLKTLKVTGEANADKDADCVIYDPFSKRIFVMDGDPHNATVIDAKSGSVVRKIDLGGGPEFAVADGKGTVYINLEDKSEVVAVDSASLKIKSRWPVAPAGAPTALATDVQHHRLFSAGRDPQMLVVLDSDNGKVLQSFPISGGVDAATYDPETSLIFASTRDGMVHIFHEDSPGKFSEAGTIKTEIGAKTMGVDAKTHNLFLDTADFAPPPAPTAEHPASPGSDDSRNVSCAGLRPVADLPFQGKNGWFLSLLSTSLFRQQLLSLEAFLAGLFASESQWLPETLSRGIADLHGVRRGSVRSLQLRRFRDCALGPCRGLTAGCGRCRIGMGHRR
jgi:DNA-binding beta-propeller fold protein YncE